MNNFVLGIIGGGQLGRMLCHSAQRMGMSTHVVTSDATSPAAQVSNKVTVCDLNNLQTLPKKFFRNINVLTFEFENVDAQGLDHVQAMGMVYPSAHVLRTCQDRILEKTFVNVCGIPTAPWQPVRDWHSMVQAVHALGMPCVAKTARMGYDGKGQFVINCEADMVTAWQTLKPHPLIVEQFVNFESEISVVVARDAQGNKVLFDVTRNWHHNHILSRSVAPAALGFGVDSAAQDHAGVLADALNVVGLLAVEMFVLPGGKVWVNELAPRPHNSAHWTMDACTHSQFDLHVRAVCGLPLVQPQRHSVAEMTNILGPHTSEQLRQLWEEPNACVHLYGKQEASAGRKMGHVTRTWRRDIWE